ncbi:MAG: phosphatidylcholine synthase [Bradyrhizobiaceae bacterium]|nr:phosphatidylcholine synthase [Bradyrhizobiaceae bacterium]
MQTQAKTPDTPKPASRGRRAAAFGVHLFTAAGAAVAFLALIAAIAGEFTAMFALLGVALVIDGVDGMIARRLQVAEILPRWSGDTLDLVVDYLTYVFVPAVALASAGLMPQVLAIPAAIAILISSAIYFADKRMKTADGYFLGFPALWNLVAFYLFLIRPEPMLALAAIAVFVVLTFVPLPFVHPLRARRWPALNLLLLVVWAALALVAVWYHLSPPSAYVLALVAIAIYFATAGLARPAQRTS